MNERPPEATARIVDEPVPTADGVVDAGSSHAAPTLTGDLLRALSCAALVAVIISSPGWAPLVAPFVPALVAIRWIRTRAGRARFLVIASAVSVVAGVMAAPSLPGPVWRAAALAVVAALALVPALGLVHVRAARPDPAVLEPDPWPEPTLRSGFSVTLGAWFLAILVMGAASAPLVTSVADVERRAIKGEYERYSHQCRPGGELERQDAFCELILEQRDQLVRFVGKYPYEVLGVLLAVLAFGAAATAHPVVLGRSRRTASRVRPGWKLRELELHWIAAYLTVLGLAAWLTLQGDEALSEWARAAGIALGAMGALMVVAQGLGFVAWLLTRGRTPRWYRVVLVLAALLGGWVTVAVLFCFGVLDMGIHPRRRFATSGSVPNRGSGS